MYNFYVYILIDPRNNKPFYIGKGSDKNTDRRFTCHLREAYTKYDIKVGKQNSRSNKIRKIKKEIDKDPIFKIYSENLLEEEAFKLESKLIKDLGRKDLGDGPLTNLTDGGEGSTGWNPPDSWRKNRSEFMKKNNPMFDPIVRAKFIGENHPMKKLENKIKFQGENHPLYGKTHSEESKKKMSKSMKGKGAKKVLVDGTIYDSISIAAKVIGVDNSTITYRIKTCKNGYKFI